MGSRIRIAWAVLLLALPAPGQDTLRSVFDRLDADEQGEAKAALIRILVRGDDRERFANLKESYEGFADRGRLLAWIEATSFAVDALPGNVLLRYFRAFVEMELKLLRRAKFDLSFVRKEAPDDPYFLEARARLADLSFDHRAAVALAGIPGTPLSDSIIERSKAVQDDLDRARSRQILVLAGAVLAFAAACFAVRPLLRS